MPKTSRFVCARLYGATPTDTKGAAIRLRQRAPRSTSRARRPMTQRALPFRRREPSSHPTRRRITQKAPRFALRQRSLRSTSRTRRPKTQRAPPIRRQEPSSHPARHQMTQKALRFALRQRTLRFTSRARRPMTQRAPPFRRQEPNSQRRGAKRHKMRRDSRCVSEPPAPPRARDAQ